MPGGCRFATRIRGWLGWLACGLVLALLVAVGPAAAQLTETQRDFVNRWEATAARAEEVIDARRASDAALEQLRQQLVDFRQVFHETRLQNQARIETLKSQIEALGPPPDPDSGESEPEDITRLRAQLKETLQELRLPRVLAEEAYTRADGLIDEIDRIFRERRTDKLTTRGPSPLNPEYWPDAWRALRQAGAALWYETAAAVRAPSARENIRSKALAISLLSALGLILLVRSRRWAERIGAYLRQWGGRGVGVWSFVVSLFKVILPLAGVIALVTAALLTGIPGLRGTMVLDAVPHWAFILLSFRWLAEQLLVRPVGAQIAPAMQARKTEVRFLLQMLAVMLVLQDMVNLFERLENISDATYAVVGFPGIVLTGLILLRLQRLRAPQETAQAETPPAPLAEDGDGPAETAAEPADAPLRGTNPAVQLVRRLAFLLGIVSPFLAAVGFVYAAESVIYPVVLSLALISVVLILQRLFVDIFAWLTGKPDAAGDSLFSVLMGFALALLALPVAALIWGARWSNLTEIWARFLEGFTIGDVQISPANFVLLAVIFAAGYTATRLVQGGLRNALLPKTRIDPGSQNAIVAGIGYVGIFLAALIAITSAGIDLTALGYIAGALSVGIGFGLQNIVSNFVSGIILLVERPVSKGDWISVGGQMGYVRDISVRSTRIETFDRTDVIVPNSDLISGSVTNYTRGNTIGRVIVPVGVAYGTDTRKVEKILTEIANSHPMVLANPAPAVVFQGFGADSLDFEIRAILRDVNWMLSVKSDMNHEIARRFAEAGIEIPFAQRDLWLRNPEALRTHLPHLKEEAEFSDDPPDRSEDGGAGD